MTDPSEIQTWILNKLKQVDSRLDSLEANSHNVASSDQPFVGPPSSSEDSRALARPVSLAEAQAWLKDELRMAGKYFVADQLRISFDAYCEAFLQRLTELDHGPVAKKPAFDWRRDPRVNATESQQSEA